MLIKPRLYFAHVITDYGTVFEQRALRALADAFPDHEIINPGNPAYTDAIGVLYPLAGFELFEAIARRCEIVVASPFPDGLHGAGVYGELKAGKAAGAQVLELGRDYSLRILDLDGVTPLSVAETKARVRPAKKDL